MALFEIPVNANIPDQRMTVDLDGIVYVLHLLWNQRTNRWALSLLTEEEDPIVAGVALVTNYPFLDRFKDERLPPGDLFVGDVSGAEAEPTIENLGKSCVLFYQEAAA